MKKKKKNLLNQMITKARKKINLKKRKIKLNSKKVNLMNNLK
jgi:hypothetical protein